MSKLWFFCAFVALALSSAPLSAEQAAIKFTRFSNVPLSAFREVVDDRLEADDGKLEFVCQFTVPEKAVEKILLASWSDNSSSSFKDSPILFVLIRGEEELLVVNNLAQSLDNEGHIYQLSMLEFRYLFGFVSGLAVFGGCWD